MSGQVDGWIDRLYRQIDGSLIRRGNTLIVLNLEDDSSEVWVISVAAHWSEDLQLWLL